MNYQKKKGVSKISVVNYSSYIAQAMGIVREDCMDHSESE